jgi:sec-independent protein translocase protein TatC
MSNIEAVPEGTDSLIGHLSELRERIVRILFGVFLGMAICYNFTPDIFNLIRAPIAPYLQGGGLIFTAPMDKFVAHLKLAFFGGILMVFPYIAWQIWGFISPGLYAKEKKYAVAFILIGSILFALGISFAYFVVFPMAFKFLMTYGGDVDKPLISIGEYMSFFVTTALAFGAAFELPLVIVILGMMEIVSQAFLRKNRRYAIMGLAVMAAIITPPDLLSMVLMLMPLLILFESAVFVVGVLEKSREKAAATEPVDL